MPKVISFLAGQGGTGKTTLCANIGYNLANIENKRVLLVDLDPNGGLTRLVLGNDYVKELTLQIKSEKERLHIEKEYAVPFFDSYVDSRKTTYEIIHTKPDNIYDLIYRIKSNKNFSIIPSHSLLFSEKIDEEDKLYENLVNVKAIKENYDYILIDTASTLSMITEVAIRSSDFYIVSSKLDYYSIPVISNLLAFVSKCERGLKLNKEIPCLGILPNFIGNNTRCKNILLSLKNGEYRIKKDQKILEIYDGWKQSEEIPKLFLKKGKSKYIGGHTSKPLQSFNDSLKDVIENILILN